MNQVKEIAALCFKHCDEAVGIIAFLEAGNTPDVETNYCGGAHVGNLIKKAMQERLLMLIMRMHDGKGTDRETLLKAFSLLEDQTVRRELSKHGNETRLDAAIAKWSALKDDAVKQKMRAVRDFESAHNIPSKARRSNLCMSGYLRFSRETINLVEDLAAGAGVVSMSFDGARQIWAERAASYWECLQRRVPAK
jgi:hypothetical protein